MTCKRRSDFNQSGYADRKQMVRMLQDAHCLVMFRSCLRAVRTKYGAFVSGWEILKLEDKLPFTITFLTQAEQLCLLLKISIGRL